MNKKSLTTKFPKGISGNKGGRPKGAKNKETLLREVLQSKSESLIIKHLPQIVAIVIKKAEEGDLRAAKMILDRVIPIKRAVELSTKGDKGLGIKIIVENLIPPDHSSTVEGEFEET